MSLVAVPLLSAAKPNGKDAAALRQRPDAAAAYFEPTVAFINKQLRQNWADYGFKPSDRASDGKWCRRVYLDVLGRIPSVAELDAFLDDRRADKRIRLVDRLLSDQYATEYARHWTTIWTNILIGRSGGNDAESPVSRQGMQHYLRESFRQNKSYDQMVSELISARGTNKPDQPGFNGAVNFLAGKLAEDGVQATAQTSQLFLGVRVQCTQCHDHPFNNWKQNQFWEMNSFFRQTVALRRFGNGQDIAYIDLDNEDYEGPSRAPEEAEVYYELRNGVLQAAYPVFTDIDGARTELDRSGFLDDVNRRSELARLVVDSGYLPVAMVNRMWAHFFSYGFTKPFDDLGPHNPPTQPELLEKLAEEFRNGGYDIKQLIRWITLSEPYQLSSRFNKTNQDDDPQRGNPPAFSRFYPRQMQAEQLYESLLVATEAHKTRGAYEQQEEAKRMWLAQFVIAFGTDENDETSTFNGTIPQILMMMNGDLIRRATSTDQGGFLQRVASDPATKPTAKIQLLFRSALAREATKTERNAANTTLARRTNIVEALQDVWWVLLNSNEFILNH
ncbi:MAG: DUF1549 domain-containing protein [Planctomycetales bacterium]|nr:DUF1549 domain-containing protein [Planctomycetales bacterium]NIM08583.1 DUF1549 domain-containing protein [Planctomycetales bacterium]NIN08052.1 DUF1549 domain-containing protein [Planctomycetales bacterium]NIN77188.1 DUF1549 domain-containing protein [Planctomycetales bacterium]NIO34370.1 DUF1549 domain-containing protein [Planctomycetales bacterium]